MTKRPLHVTVEDHGRRFRCRNCGQTADFTLPAPIREWAEAADAFSEAHQGCEKAEERSPECPTTPGSTDPMA